MRHVVQKYNGIILYLIRIPTRFGVMYLGATDAGLSPVIELVLFSLCLVAWVNQAPTTLLKSTHASSENFRTGETIEAIPIWQRVIWSRLAKVTEHLVAAFAMAFIFYAIGKFLF